MRLLIPGTSQIVRIFPTRIEWEGFGFAELKLEGPVENFLVAQDLERCEVQVFGSTPKGPLRYILDPNLKLKKGVLEIEGDLPNLSRQIPHLEKLSLGSHRKQDWELICRRLDLKDILPAWHRLGQITPAGTLCEGGSLFPDLLALFRAGFTDLLVPQAEDILHQGFSKPPLPAGSDPLALLSEGYKLIKSLILRDGEKISILPNCTFDCGRLLGARVDLGELDMEWSKKRIRRIIFRAKSSGELRLLLRDVKRFRANEEKLDAGTPIALSEGDEIFLDRFEK